MTSRTLPFARTAGLVAILSASGLAACSGGGDGSTAAATPAPSVDQFKELLVVDDDVLTDSRSLNSADGAWSFRSLVENLVPPGSDAGAFVLAWLTDWADVHTLNGFSLDLPNETRDGTMTTRIVCPWLRRTASNTCDEDCTVCGARTLDLSVAPFRLIGIVNRLDLRDSTVSEPSGEGRITFAVTSGSGDDPTSPPMPMTVNFEYRLPASRTPKEWATAWHALGAFTETGEPYRAALQSVTDSFATRGANPSGTSGSALAQVRSNESALDWIWQQREFQLDATGSLTLAPVRNTPGESLNNTTALSQWVSSNADAIMANNFEIPIAFLGGSSDTFLFNWQLPSVDESLRHAFAAETCDGCHGGEETRTVDTGFHLSPFRTGMAKVSTFLHDPAGGNDELGNRQASYLRALTAP